MASLYKRMIDARTLTANEVQSPDDILDVGAFNVLQFQVRILAAGSAGNLIMQHSATKDSDSFKDLSSGSQALNAAGNFFFTVTDFLRYLRWRTDSSVAGGPLVIADVVAKE